MISADSGALPLQAESVSDYTHPSPAESIHRRDDDEDEDDDDDGLAREDEAVAARQDLGLGGEEELEETVFCCDKCKVNLCSEDCWNAWDHERCEVGRLEMVVRGSPSE